MGGLGGEGQLALLGMCLAACWCRHAVAMPVHPTRLLSTPLQVRRMLRLLRGMQLDRRAAELHFALEAAKQRATLPTGSVLMAYG